MEELKVNVNENVEGEVKSEQKSNWVFIPVHKSRVIKGTDKYYLLNLKSDETYSVSTIINAIFKRVKETDDMIYFSVPKNFRFNIRKSFYSEQENDFVEENTLVKLWDFFEYRKVLRRPLNA